MNFKILNNKLIQEKITFYFQTHLLNFYNKRSCLKVKSIKQFFDKFTIKLKLYTCYNEVNKHFFKFNYEKHKLN